MFFKANKFISNQRSELYGRTDFLAHCGGLLGLFKVTQGGQKVTDCESTGHADPIEDKNYKVAII